ncbi:MAG: glycoside hydrolase family 88 protein [Spirochaetaceae bacterium]|jgi:unsaturated rhamnogalacturonyl hydrolase|nr:glycoside hydrolase family 88 protein [Spirochaetaceae bacterium]
MTLAEIDPEPDLDPVHALPLSQRMAASVMNRYGPQQAQWHYEHGLVLQSIFLVGRKAERDEFCRYVKEMYDSLIGPDGEIRGYREGEYNLDQINPGKTLFLLYARYGEEKYRRAIEKLKGQLLGHPRTKSGGFWHKQIYPWQMWLDGLYMQGPFYAQYTAEFGGGFDDIARQFSLIETKARDPQTGLLYHAWDESLQQKWANPDTGCSPHFWGRALGWYCMALADTLDFIPPAQAETLKAIARRLFAPLLKYQDADSGLWFQVPDRGGAPGNYTESSASSMFIYFLLKMIRLGIAPDIDATQLKAAAVKAYQGLVKHKIQEDPSGELHLTGICKVAGLGGTPYRDGSYEYYVNEPQSTDDFKGVGPFILASMEYEGTKNS